MDLDVIVVNQEDRRLGRQMVHDERSRSFAMGLPVDQTKWRTKSNRIIDPHPNPDQPRGNCTGCEKAMAFNRLGNRFPRRVLKMDDADAIYSLATTLDPWEGSWPPEDTGSSGLAAAKAAQQLGFGGEYRWIFGGADEVVEAVLAGETVGVGTWWYEGGFERKPIRGGYQIEMTGRRVGGHQWTIRGYDHRRDLMLGRCWWGDYRDVYISRAHLNDLLMDDGDAIVQKRAPLT